MTKLSLIAAWVAAAVFWGAIAWDLGPQAVIAISALRTGVWCAFFVLVSTRRGSDERTG